MIHSLRIAVADDQPDMCESYRQLLTGMGHEVVATARTGHELVECCRAAQPDLVITDIRMPGLDGIAAADLLCEERPTAVILVSAYSDPDVVERAEASQAMTYLVKPVRPEDLGPAIALTLRQFEQCQALRQEADNLRQALDDRKVIERAKGVVMKRVGVGEEEAFRRLKKLASDQNHKLVEIARTVLAAEEKFRELEQMGLAGPSLEDRNGATRPARRGGTPVPRKVVPPLLEGR
jgi:response regulator NasT